MFKNYLTYSFAIDFHRHCVTLGHMDAPRRESLLTSAKKMVAHFARSVEAANRPEEARSLAVAILCLRDCKLILDDASAWSDELRACHKVLNRRMEQLIGESAAELARKDPPGFSRENKREPEAG